MKLRNKWHRVQPFDSVNRMNRFVNILLISLLVVSVRAETLHYTTVQKQWGLATSAILTKRNHEDFYSLMGDPPVPRAIEQQQNSLRRWWGISDRKSLIKKMKWVRDEGHRAEFDQILADREKAEWLVVLRDRLSLKDRAYDYDYRRTFVEEHADELEGKSLLAWDLARLVSLARWGVLCGYMEAEEAWEWIMPAALALQETYDSWEDLAENYMLGRAFWSEYYTFESGHKYKQAIYWNLKNECSPWNRMDWGTDLTGSADLQPEDGELPAASDYFVATQYDWGGQPQKAIDLLLQVKDESDDYYRALAYNRLGNIYEHGRVGIAMNWRKAVEYYAAGAELGNADCLFEIGNAHYQGNGRAKDFNKAMEYLQAAAEAGNVGALTSMGLLYADGDGVEKDLKKAAELYAEATRWGATYSENNMAAMMFENPEIWEPEEAVELAYNAIYKRECNSHYDTLVKVLIKAKYWNDAWLELNDWEQYDMRQRDNYDPLDLPKKFKVFRNVIQKGRLKSEA
ncbi:DUF1266 domain-containing protein [Pontiellaceae bacterium B1224]|nr:DUF1266 domain-containing protein [Pontiellaceae bacterium B1224]